MNRGFSSSLPSAGVDPELRELLDTLIENERQLGEYYAHMVDLLPEDRATWITLRDEETYHAQALRQVRQAAEERPELFAVGMCGIGGVRLMIADVRDMIAKMQRQEVHPQYALTFAADIESSLLESRLNQIVKTDVVEVGNLLNRLQRETAQHRNLLRQVRVWRGPDFGSLEGSWAAPRDDKP